jgi:hypothetical protein
MKRSFLEAALKGKTGQTSRKNSNNDSLESQASATGTDSGSRQKKRLTTV